MFATYLIGLREGLEATLVVSILVAFLVKSDRRARLPHVWLGVGVAVALSVGFGYLLAYARTSLFSRYEDRELFEAITSVGAVVFVTWMIFWMRRAARSIAGELRARLDEAIAVGPAAVKGSGAPLGKRDEFGKLDFTAAGPDGEPVIPTDAHIRLAHPDQNSGARLLRRGYNFVGGSDGLGRLDAGLFFIGYQRDPRRQFLPVQRSLARSDVLNEYIRHVGSAVFACPPGVRGADGYWGHTLLE